MADSVTLEGLISALAGSVIQAQDQIEQYQITKLGKYFDPKSNRPNTVTLKLPDISPHAGEYDEVDISIPLLALVGNSQLAIKEMQVEFEVDLSGFGAAGDEGETAVNNVADADEQMKGWHAGKKRDSIGVDWQSAAEKRMARISVRVEAQETTEGMARLIQLLDKLI